MSQFISLLSIMCSIQGSTATPERVLKAQQSCVAYYLSCATNRLADELVSCAAARFPIQDSIVNTANVAKR